jgi:ribosomal protein S18 acetylase RimI-like enzyme
VFGTGNDSSMDSTHDDGIVLRSGTAADAMRAAALHAEEINEGFLSLLGPKFLRRLYRRIALQPGSFLLIAESPESTLGFIAGSTDVAALYRAFLWRDGVAAAAASGPKLLRSWRQVLETLRHGTSHAGRGAELLSVAVDPLAQGRGTGSLLVEGFLKEVDRLDHDAAYVVVAASNEKAVSLYRRAGFSPVDRFELHRGTESLVMQRAVGSVSP